MGAAHSHEGRGLGGHAAGRAADRSRLKLVLAITTAVIAVEVVGAVFSGSLALLADAGHMMTDAAAIGLALSASYVATLPPTSRRTFGFHRAEILAALVNAVVLLVVCGYVVYGGITRLVDPVPVDASAMLVFAAGGLAANAISLLALARRRDASLNMKGAYLEVLSDLLGSVLVIIAGVVVAATGFTRADAVASLLIAVMILPRSFALLKDAVDVLLEATPQGVDLTDVRGHLLDVPGVVDVHDLHAWTITSGLPMLSVHVTVSDAVLADRGVGSLLDAVSHGVAAPVEVDHATVQIEPESHQEHEHLGEMEHH